MNKKLSSPLIIKYQKAYEKNPTSKVFVPLAESYRKVGLTEKAIEILRKGLEHHSRYVTAYVILGNCYIDLKQYEKAFRTLSPVIEDGSENLRLLRLFAICQRERGELEEAKKYYKYLLFINPNDSLSANELAEIEKSSPEVTITESVKTSFSEDGLDKSLQKEVYKSADDWVRVDLANEKEKKREEKNSNWKMQEVSEIRDVLKKTTLPKAEIVDELPKEISLDLVNVYINQGLFDRSMQLIEEYLKVEPDNESFLTKKRFILKKQETLKVKSGSATLDDLPDNLSQNLEENLKNDVETKSKKDFRVEQSFKVTSNVVSNENQVIRLSKFLTAIKARAQEIRVQT